jgi:DNA-binding transcriptional ArsR family regulator
MPVTPDTDMAVARIAAVIGEPARARILVSLLDGRTRTGAELAIVAGVSASTASVHLGRLETAHLIRAHRDGRNCYYGLSGAHVAQVLQDLDACAGPPGDPPASRHSDDLRAGRRCYDHLGGELGVVLHDGCVALGWLTLGRRRDASYQVTAKGVVGFDALGINVTAMRPLRRRIAYGCPDWREGKRHLGGALGAALSQKALDRGWVQQGDTRGLRLTELGRRELLWPLAIKDF